jgi:hypothetical protein
MYIGAGLALASAALFYESLPLLAYAGFFFLATHLIVVWYEEPTLLRTFGPEYEAYFRQVRRWWPGVGTERAQRKPNKHQSSLRLLIVTFLSKLFLFRCNASRLAFASKAFEHASLSQDHSDSAGDAEMLLNPDFDD